MITTLDPVLMMLLSALVPTMGQDTARTISETMTVKDALLTSNVAESNRALRQFVEAGAIRINGNRVEPADLSRPFPCDSQVGDHAFIVSRGRRRWILHIENGDRP